MDIGELIRNVFLLIFLGLLVAFNPLLIVVDFLLVLKSKRPIFNTIVLLAGFTTSLILLFFLASILIEPNSQISLQKIKNDLDLPSVVELTAGFVLLIYGIRKYQKPVSINQVKRRTEIKIPENSKNIFVFAVVKTSLSVTNIFAVLILARQALVDNWSTVLGIIAIILVLIIGVMPLFYIMYLHWFKKESLIIIDKRLNRLLTRDITSLLAYGLILVGLLFIVKGLVDIS